MFQVVGIFNQTLPITGISIDDLMMQTVLDCKKDASGLRIGIIFVKNECCDENISKS